MRDENYKVEAIPSEDKNLIREMIALPVESKILARGIILGLGLAERVGAIGSQPTTIRPEV